jgi:hypothetical protein
MSEEPITAAPASPPPRPPRKLRRVVIALGRVAIWGALSLMSLWAILAVYYANLSGASPRAVRAGLLATAFLASVIFIRPRRRGLVVVALLVAAVLAWYFSIQPSNNRDWAPDVARTPSIQINGDEITVRNVRDFDWQSDEVFASRWTDRTYRLSDLQSVDLFLCYWGSKTIAHGMVSFGFADGKHLCVSIEARRERSEGYSAIQSFFRQFELIYVFADERDVVRVRSNVRNEDVYLYRTNLPAAQGRALLLRYVEQANELAKTPEFYNALTSNCITNIVYIARVINPSARISWDVLLSGYVARRAYSKGRLDTSMPFEELEKRSLINNAARAANNDPDFSRTIRVGLPVPAKLAGSNPGSTPPATTRQ